MDFPPWGFAAIVAVSALAALGDVYLAGNETHAQTPNGPVCGLSSSDGKTYYMRYMTRKSDGSWTGLRHDESSRVHRDADSAFSHRRNV